MACEQPVLCVNLGAVVSHVKCQPSGTAASIHAHALFLSVLIRVLMLAAAP